MLLQCMCIVNEFVFFFNRQATQLSVSTYPKLDMEVGSVFILIAQMKTFPECQIIILIHIIHQ